MPIPPLLDESPVQVDDADDRRRDQRFHARFDVRFSRVADAARALNAFSLNFSAGGLCIRSSASYSVGDLLKLDVSIGDEQLALDGVVAWARGGAVGVRFVNVSAELRTRLEHIARTMAQHQRVAGAA